MQKLPYGSERALRHRLDQPQLLQLGDDVGAYRVRVVVLVGGVERLAGEGEQPGHEARKVVQLRRGVGRRGKVVPLASEDVTTAEVR